MTTSIRQEPTCSAGCTARVEALKHDLGGLRTGRASTALLDP